jgi:alkylation response protein AidB-like acyl-CoA dehydrogenase
MVVVTDDEAFDVPLDGLTVTPVQGLDASLNLVKLAGDIPQSIGRPMHWNGRVAVGQLAIGHQLVGAARAMLELATDHARERVQFGRPISSFQAVRHRLADTLVAVEAADALLDAAWEDTTMAAMGKAFAGQAARTAARHCQQVLAGIGFTAEHPFHRYLRRTLVLDQLLGSGRRLTRQLGESVRETRRLPPMLKLRA